MIIEINKNNIDLINNSFISKEYILNELVISKNGACRFELIP